MVKKRYFFTSLLSISLLGLLEGCGSDCAAGYDDTGTYNNCLPTTIEVEATTQNFSRTMGGKVTLTFFEFNGEVASLSADDIKHAIVTVAQFTMAPEWSPSYDVGPGPHLSSSNYPFIQSTSDSSLTIQLTPDQMKLFSPDPIFHDVLWVEVKLPGGNLGWTKIHFAS